MRMNVRFMFGRIGAAAADLMSTLGRLSDWNVKHPMFQPFRCGRGRENIWMLPVYGFVLGPCADMCRPNPDDTPRWGEWRNAIDPSAVAAQESWDPSGFYNDLVSRDYLPTWTEAIQWRNDAYALWFDSLPQLGRVRQKPIYWRSWCPGVHQFWSWVGTSRQGKGAKAKKKKHYRGGPQGRSGGPEQGGGGGGGNWGGGGKGGKGGGDGKGGKGGGARPAIAWSEVQAVW